MKIKILLCILGLSALMATGNAMAQSGDLPPIPSHNEVSYMAYSIGQMCGQSHIWYTDNWVSCVIGNGIIQQWEMEDMVAEVVDEYWVTCLFYWGWLIPACYELDGWQQAMYAAIADFGNSILALAEGNFPGP